MNKEIFMAGYVVRRSLELLVALFVLATFSFFMIHMMPGDPASLMLGPEEMDPIRVAEITKELNLDQPLWIQYSQWLGKTLRGDLGFSYYQEERVIDILVRSLSVTICLVLFGLLISIIIGIPTGILAAIRPNTLLDKCLATVVIAGISFPQFWFGLVLIFLFAVQLRWFPVGGWAPLSAPYAFLAHSFLPALTLGFSQAALLSRLTRSTMLDVFSQNYVTTARSKGLREPTVIVKHALKNASPMMVTMIGLSIGILLGGSVIVETVFTIPGFGRSLLVSVMRRDYPVIQAYSMFVGSAYLSINFLVDVLYAYLDPRISVC